MGANIFGALLLTFLLDEHTWNEIHSKPEIYIPNYDEMIDTNGDLIISINNYLVNETDISLKADVKMDYWYDEHTQKRMIAKINTTIDRTNKTADQFKMRFIRLDNII